MWSIFCSKIIVKEDNYSQPTPSRSSPNLNVLQWPASREGDLAEIFFEYCNSRLELYFILVTGAFKSCLQHLGNEKNERKTEQASKPTGQSYQSFATKSTWGKNDQVHNFCVQSPIHSDFNRSSDSILWHRSSTVGVRCTRAGNWRFQRRWLCFIRHQGRCSKCIWIDLKRWYKLERTEVESSMGRCKSEQL